MDKLTPEMLHRWPHFCNEVCFEENATDIERACANAAACTSAEHYDAFDDNRPGDTGRHVDAHLHSLREDVGE